MDDRVIIVSVVLPTYNRLPQLQKVLEGLASQTYPPDAFEVIVVSDGATDGTNDYLRTLHTPYHYKPILQQNQGVAAARNIGIREAVGEFVLFIDDDVVPEVDLIQEHMRLHCANKDDNGVVIGPMLIPKDYELAPWVAWEQDMLYKQYEDMRLGHWQPTARQFYTGNTSLARKHLIEVGGFDPQFRRAEDVELAYRLTALGVQFIFAPQAVGYHYADRSFHSWMSTPYAYGRNDVIFTQQKGQDWLLPTIFTEFHTRHIFIQHFVRTFLGRPRLSKLAMNALVASARAGAKLHIFGLSRIAYSGIFSLKYYQGVADKLGGRSKFFAGVDAVPRES